MSEVSPLHELGPEAMAHRKEVDEVKRRFDITHNYFDCWIYCFLENKKYNIEETVSKLQRRFAMEVNELGTYEFTDFMRESLRSGTMQYVGEDKEGRVTFYVTTRRDKPSAKHREEQKRTFDMMVTYGSRLRRENKRCQIAMLINQDKASIWSNVDMGFQADIALRIAKFFPGCVDKMYICKMNSTLAAMAKPIFKRLPSIVSDRIIIMDESSIQKGGLLELYDPSVLPIELGGTNDCDHAESWEKFASTIESYYAELKLAIKDRSMTVKEWELKKIGLGGPPEPVAAPGAGTAVPARTASFIFGEGQAREDGVVGGGSGDGGKDADVESLETCFSVLEERFGGTGAGQAQPSNAVAGEPLRSWNELIQPLPSVLAVFFLDELLRWRTAVEDAETVERFKLLDAHTSRRQQTSGAMPTINLADKRWYSFLPAPMRDMAQLTIYGFIIVVALYFIGSLIFFSSLLSDILLTIFLGFFVESNFVFPLFAVFVMAAIQAGAICTRVVSVIIALYRHEVIPPFERLPTAIGSTVEVVFFVIISVTQFIIFCVYARRESPLLGLQISIATGWISTSIVILVTHVFFFTGMTSSSQRHRSGKGFAALPFYMALNLQEQDEDEATAKFFGRGSAAILCCIPLILGIFFGTAFLLSGLVGFCVAMVITSLIGAFSGTYYSEFMANSISGAILRIMLWILTAVWIYDCFVFGFNPYQGQWCASTISVSVIGLFVVVLTITSARSRSQMWTLRATLIVLSLLLLALTIACFPIVGWKMGVLCVAMLVHNVLSIVLSPADLTEIYGVFFAATAAVLLLVGCVLLGWYGTTLYYDSPHSLPPLPHPPPALTSLERYHRYPVCNLRLGTNNLFGISEMALMTELIAAGTTSVFNADWSNWFGSTDVVYYGVVETFGSASTAWQLHKFQSVSENLIVYAMESPYVMPTLLSTAVWIDSLALTPLHMFLPPEWASKLVKMMSFVGDMISFHWQPVVSDLTTFLENAQAAEENATIILTGHGLAGGLASIAGTSSQTQTIVFGSPGLVRIVDKLSLSSEDYQKFVLSVGAKDGVLDDVGGQDDTIRQQLRCFSSSGVCLSMSFVSWELLNSCAASTRQHVSPF